MTKNEERGMRNEGMGGLLHSAFYILHSEREER